MSAAQLTRSSSARRIRDYLQFFLLWLRSPTAVGAVMPSGSRLARAMASEIDVSKPGLVVELGGGTGQVTAALLNAGVSPTQLAVLEVEPSLCAMISARFPEVRIIRADARDLHRIVEHAGICPVKAVVSSLPLVSMTQRSRRAIISQAFATLPEDGAFIQFTYGPVSPVSRTLRAEVGIVGERRRWIRLNIPPATVWRYRRAAPSD